LKAKYGYNDITHVNTAKGGTLSTWGVTEAQSKVASYSPDLVFIGFGMNDGTLQVAPATFKANIKGIIDAERAANANSEFILIAPMLANPDTLFDGCQDQYLAVLEELESQYSGVAVADMTSTHQDLLEIKSYQDMTGNNVNHPNDFMVRYYAQTMLTLLSPSALAEDKADAIRVLNAYKNPADYRPAEQAEIQSIIAAGTANINAATSTAEVRTALNAAKAQLDALKTAAEYEAENLDYTNLNFGSAATLTTISRYNHVSSSLNSGSGVTNFASTGDDPYFRINYDPGNVSADTYKYIVIVYNVPSGVTNTSITQVFFQSGSNTSDAEARSITFTTEKGHYAYKLIDLSAASYWTGKIHSIRIDPFQNYVAGDSISIKSVRLFETSAEAATYGGRTVGILSGSYIGINESIQFDTPSEITRITSTGGTRYRGDVDENGVVTSQDYNKLKRFMACYVIEGFNEFLADANADGIISIKDCLKIKKDLANLTSPLTVEGASSTATYSSTYKCAQLDATSAPGTVLIDVSDKHLSADDFQNIALVYQNRSGGSYTVTASLMRNGSEIANSALTFTAQATQQYVSTPLDFSSVAGWSGDIDTIKLTFNGTSMHLGGIIISDSSTAVASKGNTKAQ
ncbi:MAG: hypothetical protein IKN50_03675, partial [Clostridia bacterium]|nr:hypothetical protein [Clostridia bacterium]